MISKIEYKKYLEEFHSIFDEERIYKIFLLNNMFSDSIGDEDELLYYASTYLYLYIKAVDDAVDKKSNKAFSTLLDAFDYQKKCWELFTKYCDQSKFEPYWNKYISLTKVALQNRLKKENIKISDLWKMSSFLCLIPVALCIKHNKIDDIEHWDNFIANLFCAIQIMDDIFDLLEDSNDNVFNIFNSILNEYQGKNEYISMYYSIEYELIDKSIMYINNAIKIAESLSATKWVTHCNEWKNQLKKTKAI